MVVPAKAGTQSVSKIRLIEEMNPEWKDLSEQAF
jgi:predicted GIY-YIG superfamily endonuclease